MGAAVLERIISSEPCFTMREKEILSCIAKGLSNKEIAGTLVIDLKTVERHKNSMLRKLGANGDPKAIIVYALSKNRGVQFSREVNLHGSQMEIFMLRGEGYSNDEIAQMRGVKRKTVEFQINNILNNLSCSPAYMNAYCVWYVKFRR